METVAIILAGGKGERFGGLKQFIPINGVPVFIHTLWKFANLHKILVVPKGSKRKVTQLLEKYYLSIENFYLVVGGETRQESVYIALDYCLGFDFKVDNVIITDANRPCVTEPTIAECISALEENKSVATVCKSINTTCFSYDGEILGKVHDRTYSYEMLMPQAFDFETIYKAHRDTTKKNASDDTQLLPEDVFTTLVQIPFWEGLKLTYPDDYKIFETLLK
jgi:2-C-methyl-D-erythritol 4-phosphate cytidylyltransferase